MKDMQLLLTVNEMTQSLEATAQLGGKCSQQQLKNEQLQIALLYMSDGITDMFFHSFPKIRV